MRASILIPTRNDAEALRKFLPELLRATQSLGQDLEILILNDSPSCPDLSTSAVASEFRSSLQCVRYLENTVAPFGFGYAVRRGIEAARGAAVIIMMADGSDRPEDLLRYIQILDRGAPAVLGNRFIRGGEIVDYPKVKWLLNRVFNLGLWMLPGVRTTDTTNAFKAYARSTLTAIGPLRSSHFEITVELPLRVQLQFPNAEIIPVTYQGEPDRKSSFKFWKLLVPYMRAVVWAYQGRPK